MRISRNESDDGLKVVSCRRGCRSQLHDLDLDALSKAQGRDLPSYQHQEFMSYRVVGLYVTTALRLGKTLTNRLVACLGSELHLGSTSRCSMT